MAPRRSRSTRRQRRLRRLARTVVVTLSLVVGGIWWAQDEEPSGPPVAAAPDTHGVAAMPAAAPAEPGQHADQRPKAPPPSTPKPRPEPKPAPAKPQQPTPPLARSRATSLAIPAITIEAPIIGLRLDRAGQLGTPPVDNPRVVGWYEDGPAPGERGTAVVVGHRDTRSGPAIFLNLNSLNPGNTVRVARADGRVAVFTVDKVRTYTKAEFPDKEVYGSTGRPELRVLTCGGSFDRKTGYESNVVVFAHLTDVAEKI
ncbi:MULTISPECIES: class F sortase [Streptomyces]|uniref:class F sortase n=1 Tax=Streptomyces TaxID=1883 RepID=UPI001318794B|nr:class F sortase [Streptomyces sp. QHH-9511]